MEAPVSHLVVELLANVLPIVALVFTSIFLSLFWLNDLAGNFTSSEKLINLGSTKWFAQSVITAPFLIAEVMTSKFYFLLVRIREIAKNYRQVP